MRGDGGDELGGGGRLLKSRAESGDGRGRATGVDSEERGDGGITDRDSDEPNIDWRGEEGVLVAGDRGDIEVGAVEVAAVAGEGCCMVARATDASVGSAGGRAVCPSRALASACRAIARAAADKPLTSSAPGAGVTVTDGARPSDC